MGGPRLATGSHRSMVRPPEAGAQVRILPGARSCNALYYWPATTSRSRRIVSPH
jgi:hypothetical protein